MLRGRSMDEALENANRKFEKFKQNFFKRNIKDYNKMKSILKESKEVNDKFSFDLLYEDMYNVINKQQISIYYSYSICVYPFNYRKRKSLLLLVLLLMLTMMTRHFSRMGKRKLFLGTINSLMRKITR